MLVKPFAIIKSEDGPTRSRPFTRLATCSLGIATGLLAVLGSGCGGGSTPTGPPGFNIASGNWVIPLVVSFPEPSPRPFAGGFLTQSGNSISGILHVSGLPCFDPIADPLMVQGSVSSDFNAANALTLSTSPVRGQVLSVSATWNKNHDPGLTPTAPPNPVISLVGRWTLSGGACAGTGVELFETASFDGKWHGDLFSSNGSAAGLQAVLSQTGPDANGFFQVSGTFSVAGSPCFTSGTIANTNFTGEIAQITVTMDSGVLTGSARTGSTFFAGFAFPTVSFNLVAHGGSCDGQSFTFTSQPGP